MGRPVEVLLQFWALEAFRADRITKDHRLSPEAGEEGRARWEQHAGLHWSELLRQAKEIGDVEIHACSLSMDLLGIEQEDLDPLVDDVCGVAAFFASWTGRSRSSEEVSTMTQIQVITRSIDARGMPCPGPLMS